MNIRLVLRPLPLKFSKTVQRLFGKIRAVRAVRVSCTIGVHIILDPAHTAKDQSAVFFAEAKLMEQLPDPRYDFHILTQDSARLAGDDVSGCVYERAKTQQQLLATNSHRK